MLHFLVLAKPIETFNIVPNEVMETDLSNRQKTERPFLLVINACHTNVPFSSPLLNVPC